MDDETTVAMTAIAAHTFAGVAYQPGDTYDVAGDSTQTAAQYADTLTALQFATRTSKTDGKRINAKPGYKTTEVDEKRTTAMTPAAPPKKKATSPNKKAALPKKK